MNWLFWLLPALYTIGALATVASVGKPRKPITPGLAATVVATNGLLIGLLIIGWPA